ncbi:MAG: hypothetical protein A2V72_01835 [Candidatus Nealsonbacteria bacterium RBG_13_37_56]|uniref:Transposase IS200-like domain-containing protein n=1 Tax=Candidatus Nealsonbacteria bacterium RBG_13_37_56 TaxID=1801661 RepID=A0A1G2DYI9_9BACT|nr:MAG: hypothetical protein A2V72_01835 [Candidatus Nealsonbacteria bacterium RBG_13_37_56]
MRKIKFEIGKTYHVYNQGVNKCNIFLTDADRWRFLQGMYLFNDENSSLSALYQIEKENKGRINFTLLKNFIEKNKDSRKLLVEINADCLMPNHFHLILKEIKEDGISRYMQKLGSGYANYFNKKHGRVGSLFRGPFKAIAIKDDFYLQYLLVYLNVINPGQLIEPELKEKGVVDIEKVMNFAEEFSFSTNLDYLGNRDSVIINKGIFKEYFPTPQDYKKFARDILESKKYGLAEKFFLE